MSSMGDHSFDELVAACFQMIDKSGDKQLSRGEFKEWFESSDLPALMSFKEFYRPINKIDIDRSGCTDEGEFVRAMEHFKK